RPPQVSCRSCLQGPSRSERDTPRIGRNRVGVELPSHRTCRRKYSTYGLAAKLRSLPGHRRRSRADDKTTALEAIARRVSGMLDREARTYYKMPACAEPTSPPKHESQRERPRDPAAPCPSCLVSTPIRACERHYEVR